MMNPIKNLTFGGLIQGSNFEPKGTYKGVYRDSDFKGFILTSVKPAKSHSIRIQLHTDQTDELGQWKTDLLSCVKAYRGKSKQAKRKSIRWWNDFWDRSFIYTKKR